jgi:putative flippase GtrA
MRPCLTLGLHAGTGPWFGRVLSYVAAATVTFGLNRAWTFRAAGRSRSVVRDWGLFLVVNLVGFACNYGTYAAMIAGVAVMREHPVLAVAAGSIAGMAGNFILSRRYVFRSRYEAAVAAYRLTGLRADAFPMLHPASLLLSDPRPADGMVIDARRPHREDRRLASGAARTGGAAPVPCRGALPGHSGAGAWYGNGSRCGRRS